MGDFFYWFGVLHVAAYTFIAFMVAFLMLVEWTLDRLKIKREIVRALYRYHKDRAERERMPG